jgi:hypothetical protein
MMGSTTDISRSSAFLRIRPLSAACFPQTALAPYPAKNTTTLQLDKFTLICPFTTGIEYP